MSNIVRYFETDDGDQRRLVEHRKSKWESTGPDRFDRKRVTVRRWFTIEEYDGSSWSEVEELGDYVEPKNAPHK
jgi:hypothetical protein